MGGKQCRLVFTALIGLAFCAPVMADFQAGFEAPDYNGAANGVKLTGQQGWYLPSGTDYNVYTYAGNTYGFAQNPQGGGQFVAGRSLGDPNYARAQHDFNWMERDIWAVSFDVAAQFNGPKPAADYLGSFSMQPSADARYFQTLNAWNDLNNPSQWHSWYVTQEFDLPGKSPGPAWDSLDPNHWYRQTTIFKMSTREILEVAIQDLTSGQESRVQPQGWHLKNINGKDPTALRFFCGGATEGNIMAWDNLNVVPEPAGALVLLAALLLRRR